MNQIFNLEKFNEKKTFELHIIKQLIKISKYLLLFLVISFGLIIFNVKIFSILENKQSSIKQILLSFFNYETSFEPIHKIIWVNLASIVAASALCIAALLAQSFLQNPLADASTLGMIDASIFGIIFMKSYFVDFFSGNYYEFTYVFFSLLSSFSVMFLLTFLIKNKKYDNLISKLILLGLILSIFFKTLIHIIKVYSVNSINTIFSITMGGPENVYHLFSNQYRVLMIGIVIMIFIFFYIWSIAGKLNIVELGEEQASSTGIDYKKLKIISFLIIAITTTIAITFAGNIYFVGLLSIQSSRFFFKTRKYQIILPISILFGSIISLLSVLINIFIPSIPSSIFLLFIGSLFLLTSKLFHNS